ncbi:PH domain-containing protein [Streptomyces sp. NPDC040750]|uniref:PH domain-containing protein n=1 Tax=Streptomyces sp. NPDC040750 TaxID=3154491 RepID=UPI0033E43B53
MTNPEVVCRPRRQAVLWCLVGIGAAGALSAAARVVCTGRVVDGWVIVGLFVAAPGVGALYRVRGLVIADASGVRRRALWRLRGVPWRDIAELSVRERNLGRGGRSRRVVLVLRDGRRRSLPQPATGSRGDRDFAARLAALRRLHRRYGTPGPGRVGVVTDATVGSGWARWLGLGVLLLVVGGVAASFVPDATAYERAWKAAPPCPARAPVNASEDCRWTAPAVVARTEARPPRQRSRLYFTDGRPLARLDVSSEAAEAFEAGDPVELTVWRGAVMKVAGAHYVWHEHVTTGGSVAVSAALPVLGAGYCGAQVLLRLRGRRRPAGEALPSALPYALALAGTGAWLLPLCYRHPVTPFGSARTVLWWTVGALVSAGMFVRAWRATRGRPPEGPGTAPPPPAGDDVFVAARFLEHTGYNPYGFGTHVVLGDGGPAVTPHPGPGRFAARRIPVERLTVTSVRPARAGDGDTVPRGWHIAELDDAGTRVRLAAAPDDLARVIRALGRARTCP